MTVARTPLAMSGWGVSPWGSVSLQEQQGALDASSCSTPSMDGAGCSLMERRAHGRCVSPRVGPRHRWAVPHMARSSHDGAVIFLCRPVGRALYRRQEGALRSPSVSVLPARDCLSSPWRLLGKAHESLAEAGGDSGSRSLWGPPWAPTPPPACPGDQRAGLLPQTTTGPSQLGPSIRGAEGSI